MAKPYPNPVDPDPIKGAVQQLRRLPGIGEKSATRLVYWLLRAPGDTAADLATALARLSEGVSECDLCCDFITRRGDDPPTCARCRSTSRDDSLICVVEEPLDVLAFERSGEFRGRYHVLHGAISPMEGISPDSLRIRPLLDRLRDDTVAEVILATNSNVEGDATALYLSRLLKPVEVKVTRLAHGLSVGTEIEYADSVSLARALQNRREL